MAGRAESGAVSGWPPGCEPGGGPVSIIADFMAASREAMTVGRRAESRMRNAKRHRASGIPHAKRKERHPQDAALCVASRRVRLAVLLAYWPK